MCSYISMSISYISRRVCRLKPPEFYLLCFRYHHWIVDLLSIPIFYLYRSFIYTETLRQLFRAGMYCACLYNFNLYIITISRRTCSLCISSFVVFSTVNLFIYCSLQRPYFGPLYINVYI
eukprot:Rmarinus@m.14512